MNPEKRYIFDCIDGNTAGNPVRLVKSPKPVLHGQSMGERRIDFIKRFDWIRKGLVFEPRGHDMMSGGFYYPPIDSKNDLAIIFIETSGCLPMCGHGLIGLTTILLENDLVKPKIPNKLRIETPSGLIEVTYSMQKNRVQWVRLLNVPSFLYKENLKIRLSSLGEVSVDIAFGGNFYAIVSPQNNYRDMADYSVHDLIEMGRELRIIINEDYTIIHPVDKQIKGCSHVLWTGRPKKKCSSARNAVLYGQNAIDRSPCGTGTSARMAQLFSKRELMLGDTFIHESIIGSTFKGGIEKLTRVGPFEAIIPSIEAKATVTGYNQIILDPKEYFPQGFQVF
ncbi:MAG: 4-hydroxyproline epimerase [Flavobacteriaceae bacterium]|nr:4-hydroxyproline epimerase [Flavobacteriaceae bacterium]